MFMQILWCLGFALSSKHVIVAITYKDRVDTSHFHPLTHPLVKMQQRNGCFMHIAHLRFPQTLLNKNPLVLFSFCMVCCFRLPVSLIIGCSFSFCDKPTLFALGNRLVWWCSINYGRWHWVKSTQIILLFFSLMTDELHPVHLYHTHTAAEDQLPWHREKWIKSIFVSVLFAISTFVNVFSVHFQVHRTRVFILSNFFSSKACTVLWRTMQKAFYLM